MTRTELLALADRAGKQADFLESSPADAELLAAADDFYQIEHILRQIAEAQPVAWRFEVRGTGKYADGKNEWRHYNTTTSQTEALSSVSRCGDGIEGRAVPLYTLPLED